MNNINSTELGMRISVALLRKKGHISLDEIRAIPFINYPEADLIASRLSQKFIVEKRTIRKEKLPIPQWITIFKLKCSQDTYG